MHDVRTSGEPPLLPSGTEMDAPGRLEIAQRLRPASGSLPAIDRLARLTARLLHASSAQVSLLTDVQTVAGGAGLALGVLGSDGPLADSLCTVTAAGGAPLAISDARTDPRVAGLPPVRSGAVTSYLGVPLRAQDRNGELVVIGAMCVYEPVAHEWTDQDVAVLQEIAASAVVELEMEALQSDYEASQRLLDVSITAARIGTFDVDLDTGHLAMSPRMLELLGLAPDSHDSSLERFYACVHPDDVDDVRARVRAAVDTAGEYQATYRVVLHEGVHRWLAAHASVMTGAAGRAVRMIGAAYDVTALRQAGARIEHVLDSMAVGYLALDEDSRITYANLQAVAALGRPRHELVGAVLWELLPPAVGDEFESMYRRAAATGQVQTFDAYYPAPLDAWFEVRASPEDGGMAVYFLDVTARKDARLAVEAAAARLDLLATVTAELSEAMDDEGAAAARLLELVVPALADWGIASTNDTAGSGGTRLGLRDVAHRHADTVRSSLLAEYTELRLTSHGEEQFQRVLSSTRPVLLAQDATAYLRASLPPGRASDLLGELAPESVVAIPLRAHDRTVGLLTLCRQAERASWSSEDLEALTEVAARAGLVLDNARLYRQQRDLAEGLQRALLTNPVQPEDVQIVVRYAPAAEAAEVGGDWYDAFPQRGGATLLVIGDVVGHDTAAAAAMSQIRSLVRAFGAVRDVTPAQILRQTDQVIQTLQAGTIATAIVARLEQTPSEAARGLTRLRWSNAGHPPAMAIAPDGTVAPLLHTSPDLLLGVLSSARRREGEVTLAHGSTVLFYTDGLIERRDQPLADGLETLRSQLEQLAALDLGLDQLVDELMARMLPPRRQDDAALLAVRLHPKAG